jgi:hypothetical protein
MNGSSEDGLPHNGEGPQDGDTPQPPPYPSQPSHPSPPTLIVRFYHEFPSAPERAADSAAGSPDDGSSVEEETGKFVILSRAGEIHLVLSPLGFTPYHANIVHQYLQQEGRGRVESASSTGCRILSPEWSVHGGGHYTLQHWLHHLRLHGKSSAFGRYEAERLAPYLDAIPLHLGLAGYTVELD